MIMWNNITSQEAFNKYINQDKLNLFLFSHADCSVCVSLKPMLENMISRFENLTLNYVDVRRTPEISGQLSIFTVPTVSVYYGGREYIKKSRVINTLLLEDDIFKLEQKI